MRPSASLETQQRASSLSLGSLGHSLIGSGDLGIRRSGCEGSKTAPPDAMSVSNYHGSIKRNRSPTIWASRGWRFHWTTALGAGLEDRIGRFRSRDAGTLSETLLLASDLDHHIMAAESRCVSLFPAFRTLLSGVEHVRRSLPRLRTTSTGLLILGPKIKRVLRRRGNRQRVADGPLVLLREQLLPHPFQSLLVILVLRVGLRVGDLCTNGPLLEEATDSGQRSVIRDDGGLGPFPVRASSPTTRRSQRTADSRGAGLAGLAGDTRSSGQGRATLKEGDGRRAILGCGLQLCGARACASEVLLLALEGGVCLSQPPAIVAVEGAFGPVHGASMPGSRRRKEGTMAQAGLSGAQMNWKTSPGSCSC